MDAFPHTTDQSAFLAVFPSPTPNTHRHTHTQLQTTNNFLPCDSSPPSVNHQKSYYYRTPSTHKLPPSFMDSRDIKASPSPSVSDPSPLNPSQQSYPYLTPITPSTTLLPNAAHLTTQSQPRPLFSSQRDNMHRPPPPSNDSQPLPNIDRYLPPPAPLSSTPSQRYDLSNNHQQLAQDQHIRSQQPPPYNSSSSQNQLSHLQTRPAPTSPLPTEPLPQIPLPQSTQQLSQSMDASSVRMVNPSLQNIPPQPQTSHIQPTSNHHSQPLNRPSTQPNNTALGSPKQPSRQHPRPRSQFGQVQQAIDRQRSLQPRQPPPLPPRPAMLAPPRGSVVMQDVPRYQRQVVPSAASHPTRPSQVHDATSPGPNQQTATAAMQPDTIKQHDSGADHQRHSMYHHGVMSNPRQMAPVPAMAQQMPASPAMGMGADQHNSQQHLSIARGLEHRRQSGSTEDRGNSSAFPRDMDKRDRSFSRTPVGDLRAPGQPSSGQSPSGLHLDGASRLGARGDGDMYVNTSMHAGVDGSTSPRYGTDKEPRTFDVDSMTAPMRGEEGQRAAKPHRARDDLLSGSPDSSIPASQRANTQQRGISGSVGGQPNIQSQAGGEPRPQVFPQQTDVTNHGRGGRNIEEFVTSSQVAGMGSPHNMLERQTKLRDEEQINKSSSPRRNRNELSTGLRPPNPIPPPSNQFSRSSHDRNMEASLPRPLNQVMSTAQGADGQRFQAENKEWQQPSREKEKPSNSFSTNLPSGEPKDTDRKRWTNDGRLVSGENDSTAKSEGQPRMFQSVSTHLQMACDAATPINSNPVVSQGCHPTNSSSRMSVDRHQSPNFMSSQMEVENVPRPGAEDEKGADGAPGTAEGRETTHCQSTGVSLTDSKKKSGTKEGTVSRRQGANRSTSADDNGASQRKQLKVEDALAYLEKVKSQFSDQLSVYNQFLDIMKEFKADCIDTNEVIRRVSNLFRGHKDLILGFNTFLPPGYKIRVIENAKTGILNTGFHGPAGVFNVLPPHRKITSKASGPKPGAKKRGSAVSSPKDKDLKQMATTPDGQVGPSASSIGTEQLEKDAALAPTSMIAGKSATMGGLKSAPARRHLAFDGGTVQNSRTLHPSVSRVGGTEARAHEFERAIGFVTTIKERFADSPDTFNEFLDTLRRFREEQKSIREVFEAVADLFGPHKDLLSQFKEFIPTIAFSGIQDTKAMRDRMPAQVPRRNQGSKVISESTPSRRPGALNGKMKPRHRVRELQFFEDLKSQLGPSKAHLYTEFIKCLSLFSQGIVSKEELLHLTGEILQDDQDAHLSFLDYLDSMANIGEGVFEGEHQFSSSISSEGEPTAVDAARMAYYTSKPMSEIAAEAGIEQMHSYRRMPHDFPPCEYSGRSVQEKRTLNDTWINVTTGSEDYSFKFMRRNQNEDNLFRCEDDRYELDLVIETNASTIMKLETIVATISKLPLSEKKRHALAPGALTPIHFNAIQRIYGESGAEVVSQLKMNPSVAVPIVLRRLKEKDITWRRARMDMNKVWREVGERNFHRSLDHRSAHFKAVDKKDLSTKSLLLDIMDPATSVAARDAEMTRARGYPVENGGGGANHRSQALNAILAAAEFASDRSTRRLELKFEESRIHRVVYQLLLDVVDDEVSKKSVVQFGKLIQSFFGISFEEQASRKPVSGVSKTDVTILYGDDAVYIVFRLYHLLFERVALAFDLAREQIADRERRAKLNGEGNRRVAQKGGHVKIETKPWQLTKAMNSQEIDGKFSLGPATESLEEICDQFLELAKQFARAKLDWSRYEDKCRTLLSVDSYALFTIDKTVQKLIKAIEMMFGGECSTKGFCHLFHVCQERLAEARTHGGRLDTEGIEVVYSVAASRHVAEARGAGANLMRFQSSCDDKQRDTVLIHVIGQTGDEDVTIAAKAEKAVLDKFVEFCGCYGDCDAPGSAEEDRVVAMSDKASGVSGGDMKGSDGVKSKRGCGSGNQRRQKRSSGIKFVRYKLDDEKGMSESLQRGSIIMKNGLEWRLDGNGVMRFAAGTCDFLMNKGRKRIWDEGLKRDEVNKQCSRSKRMRKILRLDEKEVSKIGGVVGTETENEGSSEAKEAAEVDESTLEGRDTLTKDVTMTDEDGGVKLDGTVKKEEEEQAGLGQSSQQTRVEQPQVEQPQESSVY